MMAFASVLGALSLLGGRDANAPGLVVQEPLDEGKRRAFSTANARPIAFRSRRLRGSCSLGSPPRRSVEKRPRGWLRPSRSPLHGRARQPGPCALRASTTLGSSPPPVGRRYGGRAPRSSPSTIFAGCPDSRLLRAFLRGFGRSSLRLRRGRPRKVGVAAILAFGPELSAHGPCGEPLSVAGPLWRFSYFVNSRPALHPLSLWPRASPGPHGERVLLGVLLSRLPAGASDTGTK